MLFWFYFFFDVYVHSVTFMQEKEMEKQKMLYQQARLHDRGAAEMVLQMISASKGKKNIYLSTFSYLPTPL